MAEKAKEQASQLGEAAFSGAGNIAAATGLVKKEEFPADLKVIPPLPAHRYHGGSPSERARDRGQGEGRRVRGTLVAAACAAAADVCARGLPHGGAGPAGRHRRVAPGGDLTAAGELGREGRRVVLA